MLDMHIYEGYSLDLDMVRLALVVTLGFSLGQPLALVLLDLVAVGGVLAGL